MIRKRGVTPKTQTYERSMEQDEDWDVISVEDIAAEFQITFLAEIIERGEKVNVNMGDVSGWFEEDGERFHFMPIVQFHPFEDGAGFQLVHFHTDMEEDHKERASYYTFKKSKVYTDLRSLKATSACRWPLPMTVSTSQSPMCVFLFTMAGRLSMMI